VPLIILGVGHVDEAIVDSQLDESEKANYLISKRSWCTVIFCKPRLVLVLEKKREGFLLIKNNQFWKDST